MKLIGRKLIKKMNKLKQSVTAGLRWAT